MSWFFIALLAPALWAMTNFLDKFLIEKYMGNRGIGPVLIFRALLALFVLPIIVFIEPDIFKIQLSNAILIIVSGLIYICAVWPYLYALQDDDVSIAIPLFQIIPVMVYALSWLVLGETLSTWQMASGLIIVFGAVIISLDLEEGRSKFKHRVFWLMMLSSLFFAVNFLLFKVVAIKESFLTTAFWEYVGFVLAGIIILVTVKTYRQQFLQTIRFNKAKILAINGLSVSINTVAKFAFNYASLLAPLALVQVVNGFQPVFVFLYGLFLTVLFPHIITEKVTRKHLAQKIFSIGIMAVGTYLLFNGQPK